MGSPIISALSSASTITSANAVVIWTIPGVFPAGIQMQGFSADKAWSTDAQEQTESMMGVDGRKASGRIPAIVPQTYTFMANSPSRSVLNAMKNAQKALGDVIPFSATIVLPSTGESFTCINGTIKNMKAIPDAAKVLQPVDVVVEWEDIVPTLI